MTKTRPPPVDRAPADPAAPLLGPGQWHRSAPDFRRGEVPGIHSITWDSEADFIKITHSAYSRQGFALGAVLAAEYTSEHQGLLSVDDMFKF